MENKKLSNKTWIAGVVTAVAASLCCITPVLALLGGLGGVASAFSWLEPFRPYMIGFTATVFGFAWYQKLKPRTAEEIECDCEEDERPSFWQSKKFLGIVTVLAALLLAFPYYSGAFFPDNSTQEVVIVKEDNIIQASLSIRGMTCTGCEHSVNYALNQQNGVLKASSSYENGKALVSFDKSKVTLEELVVAVERETGYEVTDKEIQSSKI